MKKPTNQHKWSNEPCSPLDVLLAFCIGALVTLMIAVTGLLTIAD